LAKSLVDLFREATPVRARMIASHLTDFIRHPLDAPALVEILPKIWDKIRADRSLRYLPMGDSLDHDRLAYLRARLPLSELEQQDQYLHWAPIPADWNRSQIRNEMYSIDEPLTPSARSLHKPRRHSL
jgi:hypothetical protein